MVVEKIKNIIGFIVVPIILFFILRVLYQNWSQLSDYRLHFNYSLLIFSLCVLITAYFISNFAWYILTEKINVSIGYRDSTKNWFYSQLWKYIPGKLGIIFGRAYLYNKKGVSVKRVSLAVLIEMVMSLIAGCVLFLLFLPFFADRLKGDITTGVIWIVSGVVIVGIVVLLRPTIFKRLINLALTLMKKEKTELDWDYFDSIKIMCCYLLNWLVLGVAFFLFVNSFVSIALEEVFFLTGVLVCASVVGFISFFAPAGFGVREGILYIFLSRIMPESISVILSITSRIWIIVAELTAIAAIKIIYRINKGKQDVLQTDSPKSGADAR